MVYFNPTPPEPEVLLSVRFFPFRVVTPLTAILPRGLSTGLCESGEFSTLFRETPPPPPQLYGNSSLFRETLPNSKEQVVKGTSSRSDESVDNSLKTKEKPPEEGANAPRKRQTKNLPYR